MKWAPGEVYTTYPFTVHAYMSLGWEPVTFSPATDEICLCADGCLGSCNSAGDPCSSCLSLPNSTKFTHFMDRADSTPDHTPWYLLNSTQLEGLVRKYAAEARRLRTQVSSKTQTEITFAYYELGL